MSEVIAAVGVVISIRIADATVSDELADVSAESGPLETLSNSSESRVDAVMGRFVHVSENFGAFREGDEYLISVVASTSQ